MAAGEVPVQATATKPRRIGRGRVALALVVVAVLGFLLPPMVRLGRYKGRIASSIGNALGRKVSVGDVHLRLLPQPGFALSNVIIGEDPAFGAEPMLRADEVNANLRLASLWRGRLEIARLSLNYASLNLVRAPDGRWNIESLLARASQTPSAPTATKRPEARPRFPYIEAENGRINLKVGQEKKVWALTEGEFALWLSAEDEWSMRLAARPMRTDTNLSDTGTLKMSGRFRRAARLPDTPLQLNLSLQGAQLGQITKFVYGRDRGWRGGLNVTATLAGTPAALNVAARAAASDFRRYDVATPETLDLDVRCAAQYSTLTERLSQLDCELPTGNGALRVKADIEQPLAPRAYEVSLNAEKLPAQTLAMFMRHAKKNIPEDLRAEGDVDAAFTIRRANGESQAHWDGGGLTSDLVLRSSVLGPELKLSSLAFAIEGPGSVHDEQMQQQRRHYRRQNVRLAPELRLAVAAFHVALGGTAPADASAWFSRDGYELAVRGDARIARALQAGRALGLRVPQATADGTAKVDLQVLGKWTGFAAPTAIGSAQLRDLRAPLNGVAAPLEIDSANLALGSDGVTVQSITANLGPAVQFGGWIRMARGCETLENCPVRFDVQSEQLSLDDLNRLFNPALAERPWYDILSRPQPSVLARTQARGRFTINRLVVRGVTTTRVSANAAFDAGKLDLTEVRADLLGGKHNGTWHADFTGTTPVYSGGGTVDGLAVAQLAALMRDNWAAGTVSAKFSARLSGWSANELIASMEGGADFDWRNGVLRHVSLNGQSGPLQFRDFTGRLALNDGELNIEQSRMQSGSGIYQVSGTASLARQLGVKLRIGSRAYSISGPLEKPHVAVAASDTQAALQR